VKKLTRGVAKLYSRYRAILWRVADWLSVAGIFVFLALKTWRRSSDPIVDFPRHLYTAWRMNEGDLLYRDISCWFGPLPHLVEAGAFKLFGSGLDTILWLNLVLLVAILFLLRAAFSASSGKLIVWLVSAVFLLVFGFAEYTIGGNSNFLTPYASQATWGFAGLMLVIVALARDAGNFSRRWLMVAGIGSGVTFVCKPEFVVAASAAWLLYLLSWGLATRRSGRCLRAIGRCVGMGLAGFFMVWLAVFLVLSRLGGLIYAFQSVNWVPWSVFGSEFRHASITSRFNAVGAGLDNPMPMLLHHLEWTGMVGGGYAGLRLVGHFWERQKQRPWLRLLVASAMVIGAIKAGLDVRWIESGQAVNIPAFVIAIALFGICVRAAWLLRTEPLVNFVPLGLIAVPAALMLLRMVLNGRIYHYGFFMMPLALCFLIALMMRANWLVRLSVCIITLIACTKLAYSTLHFANARSLLIGEGRDRLYAFPFRVSTSGTILAEALAQVPRFAGGARNLVAIPYSSAFNYHLRLKNPLVAQEWNPDNLGFLGRDRLRNDLRTARPDVILFFDRNLSEYGVPYFGYDERSGASILDWINDNYKVVYGTGHSANSPTGLTISIHTPFFSSSALDQENDPAFLLGTVNH
jgi:hypothetical protein